MEGLFLVAAIVLVLWKLFSFFSMARKVKFLPFVIERLSEESSDLGAAIEGVKFPVVVAYAEEKSDRIYLKERDRIGFIVTIDDESYDVNVRRAGNGTNDAIFVVKSTFVPPFGAWMRDAQLGDAEAQFKVGDWYQWHAGAEKKKKYIKAEKWYLKSASQGHAESQNRLGILYSDVHSQWDGIIKDEEKAITWYKMAAENGHVSAQKNLADCLVEKGDYEGARKWFKLAAENGDHAANFILGNLLENHFGDNEEAIIWYKKAAEQDGIFAKHARTAIGKIMRNC